MTNNLLIITVNEEDLHSLFTLACAVDFNRLCEGIAIKDKSEMQIRKFIHNSFLHNSLMKEQSNLEVIYTNDVLFHQAIDDIMYELLKYNVNLWSQIHNELDQDLTFYSDLNTLLPKNWVW